MYSMLSWQALFDRSSSIKPGALTQKEIEQFHLDGFLTVEKLTTVADIEIIRGILDRLFEETSTSEYLFRPSQLAPELLDTLTVRRCWKIAKQMLGMAAWRSFDSAIYKHPYKDSGTPWHQDQAYNKTHRDASVPLRTVHFWIPLQPVTYANGCLQFIPNSHHSVLPHYSLSNDPTMLTTAKVDIKKAIICPLPVGGATIHAGTTLHRAPPNTTETIRRAFTLVFRRFGRLGSVIPALYRYVHTLGKTEADVVEPVDGEVPEPGRDTQSACSWTLVQYIFSRQSCISYGDGRQLHVRYSRQRGSIHNIYKEEEEMP